MAEVFTEKMKELEPIQATLAFGGLSIIYLFGLVGFTSAIALAVVKMIQIIPQVTSTFGG